MNSAARSAPTRPRSALLLPAAGQRTDCRWVPWLDGGFQDGIECIPDHRSYWRLNRLFPKSTTIYRRLCLGSAGPLEVSLRFLFPFCGFRRGLIFAQVQFSEIKRVHHLSMWRTHLGQSWCVANATSTLSLSFPSQLALPCLNCSGRPLWHTVTSSGEFTAQWVISLPCILGHSDSFFRRPDSMILNVNDYFKNNFRIIPLEWWLRI